MTRAVVRLFGVLVLAAAALLAPTVTPGPGDAAEAADLSFFDPANIISDAVFFDALSMDAGAIHAFLHARGGSCQVGADGSPCLKNYTLTTTNVTGDSLCAGYRGAANESASVVIAKVAVSCGVSPRVLLVLLQKEMGLVTTTNPTARKYERAAGYACPDDGTGRCDPAYAGLQNQLYKSAWQYKRYAAYPQNYGYRAFRDNNIQWHPNGGCGYSTVHIANQATAGLYNYTPYRPNQAALSAGYGTGDGCSSYGNRNFWNYFTDWFGSTQSVGAGAIYAKYQSLGAAGSDLGTVASTFYCGLAYGGCFQVFQNGVIYWTPGTGAWSVTGAMQAKWGTLGREWGTLGYPLTDTNCGLIDGGCYQVFQGGTIYWSPTTGANVARGLIGSRWRAQGAENGALGYPVTDEGCGLRSGGCYQVFEGGTVYWTATTGARVVSGAVAAKWGAVGRENGVLGYPVAERACGLVDGGCFQVFQGGTIYESPNAGTHIAKGGIGYTWMSRGAENGALGYPTSDEACGLLAGGCYQDFEDGSIYWSSTTGARSVSGTVRDRWSALNKERSLMGYPISDTACGLVNGGCYQVFQHGWIYDSAGTDAHWTKGGIGYTWLVLGAENGSLGYPVSDELCGLRDGGCAQHFERGSIYYSPTTGAYAVEGAIRDAFVAQGAENGSWRYPTARPQAAAGTVTQRFQGGTATLDTTTGTVTFG